MISVRPVFNPECNVKIERDKEGNIVARKQGKFAHFCPNVERHLIDESDPEFRECMCRR